MNLAYATWGLGLGLLLAQTFTPEPLEPAPTIQIREVPVCTTEHHLQWWTDTTDMVKVRKKLCGR